MLCQIAGIQYEIEYKYSYLEKKFSEYLIDEDKKSDSVYQISYTDKDYNKWMEEDLPNKAPGYIEFCCVM